MSKPASVIPVVVLLMAFCSGGVAAAASVLQFQPKVGDAHTMRLTRKMVSSGTYRGDKFDTVMAETYTLKCEAGESPAANHASIKVTFEAIRARSERNGKVGSEYDSTKPQGSRRTWYAAFIGKSVTIQVSPQGRIVASDMNDLFLALAEQRVSGRDAARQERYKEKAGEMIEAMNKEHGSRAGRVLAMKKELEESATRGREDICGLLSNVIVPLPAKAVETGGTWQSEMLVKIDAHMPIPVTCTLKAQSGVNCTIDVAGQSPYAETPYAYEIVPGGPKVSNKLAGPCEATLRIQRETGWLIESNAKAHLTGQIITPIPNGEDLVTETVMDITTSVEQVQP